MKAGKTQIAKKPKPKAPSKPKPKAPSKGGRRGNATTGLGQGPKKPRRRIG